MNREKRILIAAETVAVLDAGTYTSPTGNAVSIVDALSSSVHHTRTIRPADWPAILDQAASLPSLPTPPVIEVTSETTLDAAKRLHGLDPTSDLLALNFASANRVAGGFLTGSQAQEESLARASGLYKTLLAAEPYYAANRRSTTALYTDHAILSPDVPVFRDDGALFLQSAWPLSIYTAPAPNRSAMDADSPEVAAIPETFRRRMMHLFALAATTGHRRLILGAWGCGVFRNDPADVAALFAETLFRNNAASHFSHICFAVYDTTPNRTNYTAFATAFAPYLRKEHA